MFEHGLKKIYLPQKAHFLDSNMIANYTPAVECSMAPSLECYNQLAEKLNLGKSQKNYNIGVPDLQDRANREFGKRQPVQPSKQLCLPG